MLRTAEDTQLINHAVKQLQYSNSAATRRILFPEEATVTYPEFNPFSSAQIIAIVHIPGIINGKEHLFQYHITDGERIVRLAA
jgi:hypothetical protein